MGRRLLGTCAAVWLAILPAGLAAQEGGAAATDAPRETRDRLPQDRLDALVAGPMAIVETQGLSAAKAAFERLLAAARAAHGGRSVEVADLLTAFGVGLYISGMGSDDRGMMRESLVYLEAAIPAYRAAFGNAHPEVAVALNSYADVQLELHVNDPPQSAETALEEAYRIRLGAFGPAHIETLASLRYLARLRGHPYRTRGDRARIEAAAALFRQLIARSSNDPQLGRESAPYARAAFARMYAQNRMADEAREQLRLAVEQAASWPREDRCVFVGTSTGEVENILAGEIGGARETGLSEFGALANCFRLQDSPTQ